MSKCMCDSCDTGKCDCVDCADCTDCEGENAGGGCNGSVTGLIVLQVIGAAAWFVRKKIW